MRLSTVAAGLYGLLCALALLLIPASAHGWWGIEPDPLAGVFAVVLAMPWALVLQSTGPLSAVLAAGLLAAGMALNIAAILLIGRWWRGRRGTAQGGD